MSLSPKHMCQCIDGIVVRYQWQNIEQVSCCRISVVRFNRECACLHTIRRATVCNARVRGENRCILRMTENSNHQKIQ